MINSNPIDLIEIDHLHQAELCRQLEEIADSLPDNVDRKQAEKVALILRVDLPRHHRDEEVSLFPRLEKRAKPQDNIVELLANLAMEHATDESYVFEIIEALEDLSAGKKPENPNMLGYMLRGFFESNRRHLMWENTVVLPLARRRLTDTDLAEMEKELRENRRRSDASPDLIRFNTGNGS